MSEHQNNGCGCGCGHDHNHENKAKNNGEVNLNEMQEGFIHSLGHVKYLPIARFLIEDSQQEDFLVEALSAVFIQEICDDMNTIKERAALIQAMEDMGLITIDYDIPLGGYEYTEFKASELYAYFCKTVKEGAENPKFLGDTPVLELGSIALTEKGEKLAEELCKHDHH